MRGTAYGKYKNIFLTEEEYRQLKHDYPKRLEKLIDKMSCYVEANGKKYNNYEAALRIWAQQDCKGENEDYSSGGYYTL